MKKTEKYLNLALILIGLIACVLPIVKNYILPSKIVLIAMGISLISSAIIKNKIIKNIIAFIGLIAIIYSLFIYK